MFLRLLRQLDANALDLEQLLEGAAVAELLVTQFERRGLDKPDWLTGTIRQLELQIAAKADEQKQRRIRQLRQELDRITPAEERRAKLIAELEALEGTKAAQPVTA